MKLIEVKNALQDLQELRFQLPDGSFVPQHFHVTEIGAISKHFIDCGGTVRTENVVSFQLWNADDVEHRLQPTKLDSIIALSIKELGLENLEVEVEYQGLTIEKYGLDFNGDHFVLTQKMTDCLAKDKCGIPVAKQKVSLRDLQTKTSCCTPESGCC